MVRISAILGIASMISVCVFNTAQSASQRGIHSSLVLPKAPLVHKVHDCHADTRYAYVPQFREEANHRHRGNCRPVEVELQRNPSHCHADGRQHGHSGVGTTVHSHVGNSCRVDVWESLSGGGDHKKGCIKVGPVTFCK